MTRMGHSSVALFTVAVFSGAFLIFMVQPMVGKLILPWFGGGAGIWTVCLMFYQAALFLGYLYAYGLVRFFSPRVQALSHAGLLAAAIFILPVLPAENWRPTGSEADPSFSILILLTANIALPFVALAATGPLVQAWFSFRYPDRSPYPLYAVSNLGSLAALFAFPLVVEPLLPMREAGELWSIGFVVAALLILVCGYLVLNVPSPRDEAGTRGVGDSLQSDSGSRFVLWLLLPACAVILLMAITNKLCLDLASFPFLWILPLGLYLGSFILCFAGETFYRRAAWMAVALVALGLEYGVGALLPKEGIPAAILSSIYVQIPLLCLILFALSMLLHGELYRLRPSPRALTSFYLGVSGGGALGGLFVGLVAPWLFSDYLELHVGYALACSLLFFLLVKDEDSWLSLQRRSWRPWSVAVLSLFIFSGSAIEILSEPPGLLYKERNFFGIHRVIEWEPDNPAQGRRILRHGTTVHGAQLLGEKYRRRPISYYGIPTGIGLVLKQRMRPGPIHIGVVGMGSGSLAAYGQPGDRIRFYEIDPTVIRIAGPRGYFTFLKDSLASTEILLGDGRLSLESELARGIRQNFDVLVIDAFSSDSIPFHLMTVESFGVYVKHLARDGIIAIHASNRHLNLGPILYRIAAEIGLDAINVHNPAFGLQISSPAEWIFLSRDPARTHALMRLAKKRMKTLRLDPTRLTFMKLQQVDYARKPLWTDEFNSLIDVLGSAK